VESPRQIQFATSNLQLGQIRDEKTGNENGSSRRMESSRGEISQQLVAAVLIANANRNLSLALAYAVVGTADPVAAGLWYLPMGLTVVQAASLVPGTYRGITLCQVGHVAIEGSPRVGEVN